MEQFSGLPVPIPQKEQHIEKIEQRERWGFRGQSAELGKIIPTDAPALFDIEQKLRGYADISKSADETQRWIEHSATSPDELVFRVTPSKHIQRPYEILHGAFKPEEDPLVGFVYFTGEPESFRTFLGKHQYIDATAETQLRSMSFGPYVPEDSKITEQDALMINATRQSCATLLLATADMRDADMNANLMALVADKQRYEEAKQKMQIIAYSEAEYGKYNLLLRQMGFTQQKIREEDTTELNELYVLDWDQAIAPLLTIA